MLGYLCAGFHGSHVTARLLSWVSCESSVDSVETIKTFSALLLSDQRVKKWLLSDMLRRETNGSFLIGEVYEQRRWTTGCPSISSTAQVRDSERMLYSALWRGVQ